MMLISTLRQQLQQFRVFPFRFFQDRNSRISIFPAIQKIPVGVHSSDAGSIRFSSGGLG